MPLQTEYTFTLPRGYVDSSGTIHQNGVMRLARTLDEIESANDARVQENEAYLPVLLLSRVIVSLGSIKKITPSVIEQLFVADLAYLEDIYLRINSQDNIVVTTECPSCSTQFQLQVAPLEVLEGEPD